MPISSRNVCLLMLLLAPSCSGGSGADPNPQPTGPPVISAASMTPSTGVAGAAVTFQATVSNRPVTWDWQFGQGATPSSSTHSAPQVTLAAAGVWTGQVIARNAVGASAPFSFTYTVSEGGPQGPHILQVTSTGESWVAGARRTFQAVTTEPLANPQWTWEFAGGATPADSAAAMPTVTLGLAGTYTGTVQLRDDTGTAPPFQFSYTVTPILTQLADTPPESVYYTPGITVAGGIPAVLYVQNRFVGSDREQTLHLAVAKSPVASSADDWDIGVVDSFVVMSEGTAGDNWEPALLTIGDRFVVVYHDGVDSYFRTRLLYATATVARPLSPADWTAIQLTTGHLNAATLDAAGRPALLLARAELEYWIAADTEPTAEGDWHGTVVGPLNWAAGRQLLVRSDGRPAFTLGNFYARSASAMPSGPADWSVHQVDRVNTTHLPQALVEHAGRPAILTLSPGNDENNHYRALTDDPQSSADWSMHQVRGSDSVTGRSWAGVLDGRLTWVGTVRSPTGIPDGFPVLLQSGTAPPDSAADWTVRHLLLGAQFGIAETQRTVPGAGQWHVVAKTARADAVVYSAAALQ